MMLKRLLLLFLALWFAGCATIAEKHKLRDFEKTEKAYRKLMVQRDMEAALRMVDPEWSRNHPPDLNALKSIEVTNCDVKKVTISESKLQVSQVLEITYFRTGKYVEKKIQFQQEWGYDKELGAWMVQNGLPPFK